MNDRKWRSKPETMQVGHSNDFQTPELCWILLAEIEGGVMSALDTILEFYRNNFGTRSDNDNNLHRRACVELARMSAVVEAAIEWRKHRIGFLEDTKWGCDLIRACDAYEEVAK